MATKVQLEFDESIQRRFGTVADDARVTRTAAALEANGIHVLRAGNAAEAKQIVLDLIPDGSQVHSGASRSLEVAGISEEIEGSARYEAVRPRIFSLDRDTQADEIRRLSAAPDVMLGSAHAVTETGALLAASMSGSQLGRTPAAPGESSSSWGRRRSCRTSMKGCAGSTTTRCPWRMLARKRRTASAAR
jgi:hypothetical protein